MKPTLDRGDVAIDTATLIESFRVKLGLKTWPEQERLMREKLGDEFANGRRTGRTTRTILDALAYACTHPLDRVILSGESSFVPMLRDTVRSMALRLDLETHRIEVVTHSKADEIYSYQEHGPLSRRLGPRKFFSDHYDPQYDASLALVRLRDARRA